MYLKSVGGLTGILLMLVCLCAASAGDFRSEIEVTDLGANSGLAYEVAENLKEGDKEYPIETTPLRVYLITSWD